MKLYRGKREAQRNQPLPEDAQLAALQRELADLAEIHRDLPWYVEERRGQIERAIEGLSERRGEL